MTTKPELYYAPRSATPTRPVPVHYSPANFLERYGEIIAGALGLFVLGFAAGLVVFAIIAGFVIA